jgi:hypothetical protein
LGFYIVLGGKYQNNEMEGCYRSGMLCFPIDCAFGMGNGLNLTPTFLSLGALAF